MPDVTPRFPPDKLIHYPHMFPLDIEIWDRFLEKFGNNYTGFDYDVKVGTGTPAPSGSPKNYARMQGILSKYRIDCLGHKPSQLEIIEVKPEASTVAIGQVVTYIELYKRDFSPSLPIKGVIVTDRELPDIRHLTEKLGIDYYVV